MPDNIKRHIVIVDDNAVNLDLAENTLKEKYKLTKLISGEQLFKFLSRITPDMILLDIQMPEMNGYEVMKKLNENSEYKKIPVIFLTSQDGVYSEREGFKLGAKDFIKKPFDNEIMLSRIDTQMCLHAYSTNLEEVVDEKTKIIVDLQNALTLSFAEIIESRDGTTGCHVRNTTEYFELMLDAMVHEPAYKSQLPEVYISDLIKASTLHDIGKIGISDNILKKPGPLNQDEFENMKKHSKIGSDIIDKLISKSYVDKFLSFARDMALCHHERWNGTGYPNAIAGDDIPLYVRALSIVDVYDALTSIRPYKRAFSHSEAMEIISKDSGKFFDPALFDLFVKNEKLFEDLKKQGT